MWRRFDSNVILKDMISKYFKLIEFAIVVVLGSVEDERTFSIITFMRSKLRNLLTTNLDRAVKMYA
jgi:signal transduction histidine kinase